MTNLAVTSLTALLAAAVLQEQHSPLLLCNTLTLQLGKEDTARYLMVKKDDFVA